MDWQICWHVLVWSLHQRIYDSDEISHHAINNQHVNNWPCKTQVIFKTYKYKNKWNKAIEQICQFVVNKIAQNDKDMWSLFLYNRRVAFLIRCNGTALSSVMGWHPDQGIPTTPLTKCMLGEVPALYNPKQNKWFRKWMDDWYKN